MPASDKKMPSMLVEEKPLIIDDRKGVMSLPEPELEAEPLTLPIPAPSADTPKQRPNLRDATGMMPFMNGLPDMMTPTSPQNAPPGWMFVAVPAEYFDPPADDNENDKDKDSEAHLLEGLQQWLQTSTAASMCNEDGCVPIATLKEMAGDKLEALVKALQSIPNDGPIALHPSGKSIRLRGLLEQVRMAAEAHMARKAPEDSMSLLDLLASKSVNVRVRGIPDVNERLQTLMDALSRSKLLTVQGSYVMLQAAVASPAPPGNWWGHGVAQPPMPMVPGLGNRNAQFQPRLFEGGQRICEIAADLLLKPCEIVKKHMQTTGVVPAHCLLTVSPSFARLVLHNPSRVVQAVLKEPQNRLGVDSANLTVWLLDVSARLCATTEQYLAWKGQSQSAPFAELLAHPLILNVLLESAEGEVANADRLWQALESADFLLLPEPDTPGHYRVALQPAHLILCKKVEAFLWKDRKAADKLDCQGQIPLQWLLRQASVQKMFTPCDAQSGSEVLFDALRKAMNASDNFEVVAETSLRRKEAGSVAVIAEAKSDSPGPGSSLSYAMASVIEEAMPDRPGPGSSLCSAMASVIEEAQFESTGPGSSLRCAVASVTEEATSDSPAELSPKEKDAKELRRLLEWHFEPFNLQQNPALMSILRARRPCEGNPVFSLADICTVPDIRDLVQQYKADDSSFMMAAAMQTVLSIPMTMCATSEADPNPKIALTYMPDCRFIETVSDDAREVQPLLTSEADTALPENAFSVVSYSLASDLSHGQSPKACNVLERITSSRLEPALLDWDVRRPKIVRQLLQYSPDFICIQGIQSVGFVERCSEWEDGWLQGKEEPDCNHLLHIYLELCKEDYGVTFSPTLQLPGSDTLCFGNAMFWKRSRWEMEKQWAIPHAAICVELTPKVGGPGVLVCSSKSAMSYVQDWGDQVSSVELVEPNLTVQMAVQEAVNLSGARPVWCGDFGCEPNTLLPGLSSAQPDRVWKSAGTTVLDCTPWTSFPEISAQCGNAVDLVLHDASLEALAVLAGHREEIKLEDWLQAGYPSDHLLQFAVFAAPKALQEPIAKAASLKAQAPWRRAAKSGALSHPLV